ncbi:MAG: DsbA family protein, partial [Candidatus Yanofskybacteria bacterium]|nr:DsbA family protein [Candidatus Yanofskybacteria bacterium]
MDINKKELYEQEHQKKKEALRDASRKRMTKRVALWLFAGLILTGSVYAIYRFSDSGTTVGAGATVAAITVNDHVAGNPQAKAVIIEYSDLQCPACRTYYPLVKSLVEKYSNSIAFAYRHFPLQQHPGAKPAAYAAEAAAKQGKFWEMHDLLFDRQPDWSVKRDFEKIFRGYAGELGLNLVQYDQDINSSAVKEKVDADYQSGLQAQLNATPTFYLNGKFIQPQSADEFETLIKNA